MAESTIPRQALGNLGRLGSLYDAFTDTILPQSAFSDDVPEDAIERVDNPKTEWAGTKTDNLKEKFAKLGMSSDLSASFVSGSTSVVGVGNYLKWAKTSTRTQEASMLCRIVTTREDLTLTNEALGKAIDVEALKTENATHMICGIQWGSTSVFTGRSDSAQYSLPDLLASLSQSGEPAQDGDSLDKLSYKVHSDIPGANKVVDYKQVCEFIRKVPQQTATANNGKGYPVTYTLVSLSDVAEILSEEIEAPEFKSPPTSSLEGFFDLFERFEVARQSMNDYLEDAKTHTSVVPGAHVAEIEKQIKGLKSVEKTMQGQFASALQAFRKGESESELSDALKECRKTLDNKTAMKYAEKILFADAMTNSGAKYLADDAGAVVGAVKDIKTRDVYALHFNVAVTSSPLWKETAAKMKELLQNKAHDDEFVIVDYDMGRRTSLEKPFIELWQDGSVGVPDLVKDIHDLADKPQLKCVDRTKVVQGTKIVPPSEQRPVKITCPSSKCSANNTIYDWICPRCKDTICFGFTDTFFYCSCGRFDISDSVFKCQSPSHGADFAEYKDFNDLKYRLKLLKPIEQYNILILGETGVGKSTFINAFINYMVYGSLDEALKDPGDLKWAIPCSFSYDERDKDGYIIPPPVVIKVGVETDFEKESRAGASATQNTVTYVLNMRGRIIRLIDTPGIGDTRGPKQDYENVKDILQTLESVDKLSAIMYLMKPDSPRLTTVFDFCLTELVSHLHKDTAKNLVFGFTRAKSSNFALQGTREPLEALLRKRNISVGPLDDKNLFFFDSESFLYLAAWKQKKKIMGDKEDYAKTWRKSADEARRLINTTIGLPTHEVKQTLSLNRTRNLVLGLTKPMIAISDAIKNTQRDIADQLQNIEDCKRKGSTIPPLKLRMNVPRKRKFDRPRTVCSDEACKKVVSTGNGNEKSIVYTSICHNACYIDTPEDIIDLKALDGCEAMGGTANCQKCGHSVRVHLHTSYELYFETVEVDDEDAKKKKDKNETEQQAAERMMNLAKAKLAEIEAEDAQIKTALAIFGVYLHHSAIVAYNDATITYLDMLIANSTKSNKPLEVQSYEDQKSAYEKQLAQIKAAIVDNSRTVPDADTLKDTIDGLGKMKNYGKQLKEIIGEDEHVVAPPYRAIRVGLRPSGTSTYDWMRKTASNIASAVGLS